MLPSHFFEVLCALIFSAHLHVNAAACIEITACTDCVANPACGWCLLTSARGACYPKQYSSKDRKYHAPAHSVCASQAWAWVVAGDYKEETCPNTMPLATCTACVFRGRAKKHKKYYDGHTDPPLLTQWCALEVDDATSFDPSATNGTTARAVASMCATDGACSSAAAAAAAEAVRSNTTFGLTFVIAKQWSECDIGDWGASLFAGVVLPFAILFVSAFGIATFRFFPCARCRTGRGRGTKEAPRRRDLGTSSNCTLIDDVNERCTAMGLETPCVILGACGGFYFSICSIGLRCVVQCLTCCTAKRCCVKLLDFTFHQTPLLDAFAFETPSVALSAYTSARANGCRDGWSRWWRYRGAHIITQHVRATTSSSSSSSSSVTASRTDATNDADLAEALALSRISFYDFAATTARAMNTHVHARSFAAAVAMLAMLLYLFSTFFFAPWRLFEFIPDRDIQTAAGFKFWERFAYVGWIRWDTWCLFLIPTFLIPALLYLPAAILLSIHSGALSARLNMMSVSDLASTTADHDDGRTTEADWSPGDRAVLVGFSSTSHWSCKGVEVIHPRDLNVHAHNLERECLDGTTEWNDGDAIVALIPVRLRHDRTLHLKVPVTHLVRDDDAGCDDEDLEYQTDDVMGGGDGPAATAPPLPVGRSATVLDIVEADTAADDGAVATKTSAVAIALTSRCVNRLMAFDDDELMDALLQLEERGYPDPKWANAEKHELIVLIGIAACSTGPLRGAPSAPPPAPSAPPLPPAAVTAHGETLREPLLGGEKKDHHPQFSAPPPPDLTHVDAEVIQEGRELLDAATLFSNDDGSHNRKICASLFASRVDIGTLFGTGIGLHFEFVYVAIIGTLPAGIVGIAIAALNYAASSHCKDAANDPLDFLAQFSTSALGETCTPTTLRLMLDLSIAVIAMIVIYLVLPSRHKTFDQRVTALELMVQDYTVLVSNLPPPSVCSNEQLAKALSVYGRVLYVERPADNGDALERERRSAADAARGLPAPFATATSPTGRNERGSLQYSPALQSSGSERRQCCGVTSSCITTTGASVEGRRNCFSRVFAHVCGEPRAVSEGYTGRAFVTFEYQYSADAVELRYGRALSCCDRWCGWGLCANESKELCYEISWVPASIAFTCSRIFVPDLVSQHKYPVDESNWSKEAWRRDRDELSYAPLRRDIVADDDADEREFRGAGHRNERSAYTKDMPTNERTSFTWATLPRTTWAENAHAGAVFLKHLNQDPLEMDGSIVPETATLFEMHGATDRSMLDRLFMLKRPSNADSFGNIPYISSSDAGDRYVNADARQEAKTERKETLRWPPKLFGREIFVEKAPDPTTVLWENLGISRKERTCREVICALVVCVLIAANALLCWSCAKWSTLLTDGTALRYIPTNSATQWSAEVISKYGSEAHVVALIVACFETLINMVVGIVYEKLSVWERHTTLSGRESWLMVKIAMAKLVNVITMQTLLFGAPWNISGEWFGAQAASSSIIAVVAVTTLGEALPAVFRTLCCARWCPDCSVCDSLCFLLSCGKKRISGWRTHAMGDVHNEIEAGLREFRLAQKTSTVLFILFTGFVYSTAIPLILPIAWLALCVLYVAGRLQLGSVHRVPPMVDETTAQMLEDVLPFAVLFKLAIGTFVWLSLDAVHNDIAIWNPLAVKNRDRKPWLPALTVDESPGSAGWYIFILFRLYSAGLSVTSVISLFSLLFGIIACIAFEVWEYTKDIEVPQDVNMGVPFYQAWKHRPFVHPLTSRFHRFHASLRWVDPKLHPASTIIDMMELGGLAPSVALAKQWSELRKKLHAAIRVPGATLAMRFETQARIRTLIANEPTLYEDRMVIVRIAGKSRPAGVVRIRVGVQRQLFYLPCQRCTVWNSNATLETVRDAIEKAASSDPEGGTADSFGDSYLRLSPHARQLIAKGAFHFAVTPIADPNPRAINVLLLLFACKKYKAGANPEFEAVLPCNGLRIPFSYATPPPPRTTRALAAAAADSEERVLQAKAYEGAISAQGEASRLVKHIEHAIRAGDFLPEVTLIMGLPFTGTMTVAPTTAGGRSTTRNTNARYSKGVSGKLIPTGRDGYMRVDPKQWTAETLAFSSEPRYQYCPALDVVE